MRLIKTKTETKKAIEILAEAYYDAPNISWLLRKPTKQNAQRFFSVILQDAMAKNGAYLSDNSNGVLLFFDLENKGWLLANLLRKIWVFCFVTGISRGVKALKWQQQANSIRPPKGLFGMALAIADNAQRMQTAFEIKKTFATLTKDKQQPVYAETTLPRIKRLYQSIGFEEYTSLQHPFANVTVFFLKKETKKD